MKVIFSYSDNCFQPITRRCSSEAEQLIRNQLVGSSTLPTGSSKIRGLQASPYLKTANLYSFCIVHFFSTYRTC